MSPQQPRIVHDPKLAEILACLQAANRQIVRATELLREADEAKRK